MVLAPIFGAFVTQAVGFRLTTDIMVLVLCTFALFYFVFADGKTAFRSICRRSEASSKAQAKDDYFMKIQSDDQTCENSENR